MVIMLHREWLDSCMVHTVTEYQKAFDLNSFSSYQVDSRQFKLNRLLKTTGKCYLATYAINWTLLRLCSVWNSWTLMRLCNVWNSWTLMRLCNVWNSLDKSKNKSVQTMQSFFVKLQLYFIKTNLTSEQVTFLSMWTATVQVWTTWCTPLMQQDIVTQGRLSKLCKESERKRIHLICWCVVWPCFVWKAIMIKQAIKHTFKQCRSTLKALLYCQYVTKSTLRYELYDISNCRFLK